MSTQLVLADANTKMNKAVDVAPLIVYLINN